MANRGATWDPDVHTIADLKERGSEKIPKMYRDFFNEGAMDLITLKDNEEAYNRYKIRSRVLVNVDNIDMSSEAFGHKTTLPLGFSPAAMQKMAHKDGEIGSSEAAADAGICMILSSYATASVEDVTARGKGNPYAMQVSVLKDRGIASQMIKRAEAAGCCALVVSVDLPCLGRRLNEYRNNFALPEDMCWPNLLSNAKEELSGAGQGGSNDYDPTLDWNSIIPWLRSQTKLRIWLKGVCTADDVGLAIRHGLDGILVSNHGGRQLDGVPATLDSLRECANAAAGRIPIAMDGGIRRGSDIFKALALGASHVFVGRIPIWGLAYNGRQGVDLALKILAYELKTTMALAGCRTVKEISRSHLAILTRDGILAKL